MTYQYKAFDIPDHYDSSHRPWNQKLVEKKFRELAIAGIHYDDRVIN